jgi:hypothetical protein
MEYLKIAYYGLIDLKGIGVNFSREFAELIWDIYYDPQKSYLFVGERYSFPIAENIEESLIESKKMPYFLKDLYPNENVKIFKDPNQENIFKNFPIKIGKEANLYYAFMIKKDDPRKSYLTFGLQNLILDIKSLKVKSKKMLEHQIYSVIEHELRHAVDFVYLMSSSYTEGGKVTLFKRKDNTHIEYVNSPHEIRTFAGEAARKVFYNTRGNYKKLKSSDWIIDQFKYEEYFYLLHPENRKIFLNRVYNELQKMMLSENKKD